jgi:hypothetical protein
MSFSPSGADPAFTTFKRLLAHDELFTQDAPKLSEADTRAKLIDPLFKEVLGWTEAEIRREKPAGTGWADYIIGSDYAYLLIEAKRTKPRFRLSASSAARQLKLSGPHLMSNKKLRPLLEQACKYATTLGAQVAILTNGDQFLAFRPYLPGVPWTTGSAIAYHSYRDIEDNFAEFYQLFSRESVVSGRLLQAFESTVGVTRQFYGALDHLPDADQELLRNRMWSRLSAVMGPLLSDDPQDPDVQREVLEHCYVSTPLSDQADRSLDLLLKDKASKALKEAGVEEVAHLATGHGRFGAELEADVKLARAGTYILTGGVGSGKTTYLKHFAQAYHPDFIRHYCIWVHVDFLALGNVEEAERDKTIRLFTFENIRHQMEAQYPDYMPKDGQEVRDLFADDIRRAELTRLFGLERDSDQWTREVNAITEHCYSDAEQFCKTILANLRQRGLRTVLVLDNTDQLGEGFQEKVFLFSQELSALLKAFCIVALREEKFFAAYRRGIFDAYGDRRFHIGSPDLKRVLKTRLERGRIKLLDRAEESGGRSSEVQERDGFLKSVIRSVTVSNQNIVRMLSCVANGDMRHSLDMFRSFLSSGNTDVGKILRIVKESGQYHLPFHEFAKSAILGSRRYYRRSVSHFVNLFAPTEAPSSSHLTACRVLARLSSGQSAASEHGEGFIATSTLLREFRQSFGVADDFVHWCNELLRRGLVESEPPRIPHLGETEALRITASGAYYWRYLVRAFAYIDLVLVDTPLLDRGLAVELARLAPSKAMNKRFLRVEKFLAYLEAVEEEDLRQSVANAGPYRQPLMADIRTQIDREMKMIRRKVKMFEDEGADKQHLSRDQTST